MKLPTSLLASIYLAWALSLAVAPAAQACSVCYGDPQSPLTQAAQQGVLTMLIITYVLVIAMLTMFGFVMIRAKRGSRPRRVCLRGMLNAAENGDSPQPDGENPRT